MVAVPLKFRSYPTDRDGTTNVNEFSTSSAATNEQRERETIGFLSIIIKSDAPRHS